MMARTGNTTAYKPQPFEIAGVDLSGERQDDGTVKIGTKPNFGPDNRPNLPDFPEEIDVCGTIYTLEFIKKNRDEAPDVVVPGHPGYNLEWGIYV